MTTTSMHTYAIPYCEDFRYKNMPMIFGCFCLSGMLIPRSAYHRNARALRLYAVCRLRILGTHTRLHSICTLTQAGAYQSIAHTTYIGGSLA